MVPSALSKALIEWYRREARSLPWRDIPTPYRVLLSEFMLQQTRVDTAREYFEAFVARWPTLEALAGASEADVLAAWAGLGYYSRARNLHRAARMAIDRGGVPDRPEDLLTLPGVGPYTAGAIASIAFDVPAPAIDGNVERVLSRLDAHTLDPKSAAGRRALHARVLELLDHGAPSEITQALMELGATVCTPRNPKCSACPWTSACAARRGGQPESYPKKKPRRRPTPVTGVCGVGFRGDRILVGKRAPGGLLAHMWEPLRTPDTAEPPAPDALRDVFLKSAGIHAHIGESLGSIRHVFSHRHLTLQVFRVTVHGDVESTGRGGYQEVRLVDPRRCDGLALSKLARKILALAPRQESGWPPSPS